MLHAYNVIANDGVYVPPTLVAATVDAERRAPRRRARATSHRVVSADDGRADACMLAQVVDRRAPARPPPSTGYAVAGKTGTARKPQPDGGYKDDAGNYHYISTFAGFLPAEDPSCRSSW